MDFVFIGNSVLLGVGLAMDAFSVSIANGLQEPGMSAPRSMAIAGTYAGFQFLMPMIGWFCVTRIASAFQAFQAWIPWIAFFLLLYIGGGMIREGISEYRAKHPGKGKAETSRDPRIAKTSRTEELSETFQAEELSETSPAPERKEKAQVLEGADTAGKIARLSLGVLMMQGIATSIDALSVGFAIARYSAPSAFAASLIIAAVTLIICLGGLKLGERLGSLLAEKAKVFGGLILVAIGIEILLF